VFGLIEISIVKLTIGDSSVELEKLYQVLIRIIANGVLMILTQASFLGLALTRFACSHSYLQILNRKLKILQPDIK
jgi:hypothetical protein